MAAGFNAYYPTATEQSTLTEVAKWKNYIYHATETQKLRPLKFAFFLLLLLCAVDIGPTSQLKHFSLSG